MTPRSLFVIILKIIGLIFLTEAIFFSPQIIYWLSIFLFSPKGVDSSIAFTLLSVLIPLLLAICYIYLIYLLFFKPNVIIDRLKLDKGFEQNEFTLNISSTTIFTVICVLYGGYVFLNELPTLFKNAYIYYLERKISRNSHSGNISLLIASVIKIMLGLLVIGERKRIVAFIIRKNENE
jgi:hypothetical protein